MTFDEFWFRRTLPQIFTLVSARVERNERSEAESKNKDTLKGGVERVATMAEMDEISRSFRTP